MIKYNLKCTGATYLHPQIPEQMCQFIWLLLYTLFTCIADELGYLDTAVLEFLCRHFIYELFMYIYLPLSLLLSFEFAIEFFFDYTFIFSMYLFTCLISSAIMNSFLFVF